MYCGCPCGPVGFRGMSAYGYVGTFPPYPDVELNLSFKSIYKKKKEESEHEKDREAAALSMRHSSGICFNVCMFICRRMEAEG